MWNMSGQCVWPGLQLNYFLHSSSSHNRMGDQFSTSSVEQLKLLITDSIFCGFSAFWHVALLCLAEEYCKPWNHVLCRLNRVIVCHEKQDCQESHLRLELGLGLGMYFLYGCFAMADGVCDRVTYDLTWMSRDVGQSDASTLRSSCWSTWCMSGSHTARSFSVS